MSNKEKKKNIFEKLFGNINHKYKMVVMNESTLEEQFALRLSRMNVLMILVLVTVFSIAFTIFIIWITPLKELIPGYASVQKIQQVYINRDNVDSLENKIAQQKLYIENFNNRILHGENLDSVGGELPKSKEGVDYDNIADVKSDDENKLRKEWEGKENYDLIYYPDNKSHSGISRFVFFTPMHGTILNGFDSKNHHYGVDVVGKKDATVKATLDGRVIFSDWTFDGGYVISIQHDDDLISVCKHNASLLKTQGDRVKAGDPIAIIGNTGKLTSGTHLHFELWYKRSAVNPTDFINFN